MSKRADGGDLSSAAHKRHTSATLEEEDPLPSATSSSLAKASSSSIPKIPLDLIADLIFPFVADRTTWNSVYCASKELHLAGKKMTPPWPDTIFNFGQQAVRNVAFSPSGSQLSFCINALQPIVHVWDRWGNEALLAGRTDYRFCLNVSSDGLCLEYSSDGKYLASGSLEDGSIRLWHTESIHATSSKISREIPTRAPEQADIVLVGIRYDFISMLSFSRTDSNLLASEGSRNGEIKLWNIKDRACIHAFSSHYGAIHSLFFAGGADSTCIAVANVGSVIRFWRGEGSSDFASETIGDAAGIGHGSTDRPVFSPSGSLLATTSVGSTLSLYELETMTKTQSIIMPGFNAACFALSPDSKELVVGNRRGKIRLVQTDDFSIQRDLTTQGGSFCMAARSIAFDPSCRVLACGDLHGTLELRSL